MNAPTAEEQPLELPPTRTWSGYSSEEIDAAMERICSGGKDSGIAFFTRHPHLGFATAVQTQCELTERERQLLAALRENREMKAELDRAAQALVDNVEAVRFLRDQLGEKDARIAELRNELVASDRAFKKAIADLMCERNRADTAESKLRAVSAVNEMLRDEMKDACEDVEALAKAEAKLRAVSDALTSGEKDHCVMLARIRAIVEGK